jgi:hypothetical protein
MMRLPANLEREFEEQVAQMEAERHMEYLSTWERFAMQRGEDKGRKEGRDEGLKEGRDEGLQDGRREEAIRLLLRLLTHRFGEVAGPVPTRLRTLTLEQAEALVDKALTSQSLLEFTGQLPPAPDEMTDKVTG